MEKLILILIHLYQRTLSRIFLYINPQWGCRFYPSCSEYSCQAVKKYGTFKGLYKGFKRIIRCHPFNKGGYDPC